MPDLSAKFKQLATALHGAINLGSHDTFFNDIYDARHSREISDLEFARLMLQTFGSAKETTRFDFNAARSIIFGRLLPFCLLTTDETSDGTRLQSDFRELLRDWIEQYEEKDQKDLRDEALQELGRQLHTDKAAHACYVLATLGYRDPDTIRQLLLIIDNNGASEHAAVEAIASMAPDNSTRQRLIQYLTNLVGSATAHRAIYSLQRLADRDTLALTEHLVEVLAPNQSQPHYLHMALAVLASIADRFSEDEQLQDRIWTTLSQYPMIVEMDGRMATHCNSPNVVPALVRQLERTDRFPDVDRRLWVLDHRTRDCVRPHHLSSWKGSATATVMALLHQVASANSGAHSEWATLSTDAKEAAWRWILSIGSTDLALLLNQTVSGESNRYVQHSVMELVASISCNEPPPTITRLVEEVYNSSGGDSSQLLARIGATKLLWSAATIRAFRSLLNCGLTRDQHVLVASADAVAEVAIWLVRAGNQEVVADLIEAMNNHGNDRQRSVASGALEALASEGLLDDSLIHTYVEWIKDHTLPDYVRQSLLESIDGFSSSALLESEPAIANIASEPRDDEVVWQALVFLVRQPHWPEWERLVANHIGWDPTNSEITLTEPRLSGWRGWLVGEMFVRDPGRFAAALAKVLQGCDANTSFQLQSCIRRSPFVPDVVVNAILERIRTRVLPYSAETHLFNMLGRASPIRLLSDWWFDEWKHWRPESKIAFLDAVQVSKNESAQTVARRLSVLGAATGDGVFAVRDAAYRGIAERSESALREFCGSCARNPSVDLRLRAAEAIAWIQYGRLNGEEFVDGLLTDAVRSVREVARSAVELSRAREWTRLYVDKIKEVASPEADALCVAFPYGEALIKLGDMQAVKELREHCGAIHIPPNVRNWVRRLCDGIEKTDRKSRSSKDRSLALAWDAIVEEFDGTVSNEGAELEVRVVLWQRPPAQPGEFGEWFGVATAQKENAPWRFAFQLGEVTVTGANRSKANAVVTKFISNDTLFLSGSGTYPMKSTKATSEAE